MGVIEDQYEVMECMTRGELGEIYKIRDKVDQSIKALKIVHRLGGRRISASFYEKWSMLRTLVC